MKSLTISVLCLLVEIVYASAHYKITFVEDLCSPNERVVWNLSSGNANSSGILKTSRDKKNLRGMNCTIVIQPPLGYGVVLSIRYLDFRPFYSSDCQSFVQILQNERSTKLCGYSNDVSEYQSYSSNGKGLEIQFITVNQSGPQYHSEIEFIVTSYLKVPYNCEVKMFQCENSRCIWKGLQCDGHNNCGDQSDEFPYRRSNCGMMSPGVIAGIVVGSVMGFLLLIIIPFACCRFKSRYRPSQGSVLEPALLQPPPSYGSSVTRNDIPSPSGYTGQSNIPTSGFQQETNPSHRRYQDLPPAYKEN